MYREKGGLRLESQAGNSTWKGLSIGRWKSFTSSQVENDLIAALLQLATTCRTD